MGPGRSKRAEIALPARRRAARSAPSAGDRHGVGWTLLLISPGLWAFAVVGFGLALHMEVQLTPLLAVAPAIACAGTGRRLCIALGCACALVALTPFGGQPAALGERIGTAAAVLAVTFTSYVVVYRRIRMQRAYDEVRQIAEVTQRVLLRPIPERIGPVTTAVEYLSAATGARVGGDFYEVIDTPYGVRAILGDMRGNGLDAVSGAAAVLGAFREAGAVEPALEAVAARLDAALTRHTTGVRRAEPIDGQYDELTGNGLGRGKRGAREEAGIGVRTQSQGHVWAEDFATAVLVQIPYGELETWHGIGANEAKLVVCGHPAPYLVCGDVAIQIEPERPMLPLGLGSLIDEPYTASSCIVAFEPGDALVFYTDGVSDARGRLGEFFRLEELLRGLGGGKGQVSGGPRPSSPRSVAAAVRSRLLEHVRGELADDAALLVLGRVGGGPDGETPVRTRQRA